MKATFNTETSQVVVETSVGDFTGERDYDDLFDTWLGTDKHDVNVFCEDEDAEQLVFKATLYDYDENRGGMIDVPLETCVVEFV